MFWSLVKQSQASTKKWTDIEGRKIAVQRRELLRSAVNTAAGGETPAPDVVAEELMQGGRMPDILRTSSNAIAHDGSKLHWNIEEIWNRITRK